jgi:hypothetical protein
MSRSPLVDQEFRPVAIVALALAVIPLAASLYFLLHPSSPFFLARLHRDAFYVPLYFFIFVNALNGIMSTGVLARRKWGYHLFRILLCALLLGFPIGTVVSYSTLSYMRSHQIQRYFGLPPSQQIFPGTTLMIALAAAVVILFLWMMLAY